MPTNNICQNEFVWLAQIVSALRPFLEGSGSPLPAYRTVYAAVLNGAIQAEKDGGRWRVRRADLPVIAEHFRVESPARSTPQRVRTTDIAAAPLA